MIFAAALRTCIGILAFAQDLSGTPVMNFDLLNDSFISH